LANARVVGDRLATGAVPVPLRLAVCGLPVALSLTDNVALRNPVATGLKVTLMVQLPAAATLVPQLFVWVKSPGFVPAIEMLLIVSVALPVFERVTV
jgi:hypothetical protein